LAPNNEVTEPIPPVDTTQATNKHPAQSKYGHTYKPTKSYTEYMQQLTAKSTTQEDFGKYNEEDKTQFLDNPILIARMSSVDLDTLYLHKALKAPDSQ
jgi:hypothetical protein